MEQKAALDPFTGEDILIGGRRYRQVEAYLLDWLEDQCSRPIDPNRPRKYCGTKAEVPPGYIGRGTSYDCMKKGIKTGICTVYNKFKKERTSFSPTYSVKSIPSRYASRVNSPFNSTISSRASSPLYSIEDLQSPTSSQSPLSLYSMQDIQSYKARSN